VLRRFGLLAPSVPEERNLDRSVIDMAGNVGLESDPYASPRIPNSEAMATRSRPRSQDDPSDNFLKDPRKNTRAARRLGFEIVGVRGGTPLDLDAD